jgi:hypothetical protein
MHAEFQKKLAADSAFARSPRARLDWVYDRSPWRDRSLNEYPVARVISPVNLRTAPLAGE